MAHTAAAAMTAVEEQKHVWRGTVEYARMQRPATSEPAGQAYSVVADTCIQYGLPAVARHLQMKVPISASCALAARIYLGAF